MCTKILDQERRSEIEQALESSKSARESEWNSFVRDVENQKRKVDEAYKQKEIDLKDRYSKLETNLAL